MSSDISFIIYHQVPLVQWCQNICCISVYKYANGRALLSFALKSMRYVKTIAAEGGLIKYEYQVECGFSCVVLFPWASSTLAANIYIYVDEGI